MPLLIDAWNVLHVTGVLPAELAAPDLAGLIALLEQSRYRGEPTTLACDGAPAPGAPEPRQGGISIRYSGPRRTADDLIADLVARSSAPRRLLVVSSDREVQAIARRRRCAVLDSATFLRKLAEDHEVSRHRARTASMPSRPPAGDGPPMLPGAVLREAAALARTAREAGRRPGGANMPDSGGRGQAPREGEKGGEKGQGEKGQAPAPEQEAELGQAPAPPTGGGPAGTPSPTPSRSPLFPAGVLAEALRLAQTSFHNGVAPQPSRGRLAEPGQAPATPAAAELGHAELGQALATLAAEMGQAPATPAAGMGQAPASPADSEMGQAPATLAAGMGQAPATPAAGMGQAPATSANSEVGQAPATLAAGMGQAPATLAAGMGQAPATPAAGMGQAPAPLADPLFPRSILAEALELARSARSRDDAPGPTDAPAASDPPAASENPGAPRDPRTGRAHDRPVAPEPSDSPLSTPTCRTEGRSGTGPVPIISADAIAEALALARGDVALPDARPPRRSGPPGARHLEILTRDDDDAAADARADVLPGDLIAEAESLLRRLRAEPPADPERNPSPPTSSPVAPPAAPPRDDPRDPRRPEAPDDGPA